VQDWAQGVAKCLARSHAPYDASPEVLDIAGHKGLVSLGLAVVCCLSASAADLTQEAQPTNPAQPQQPAPVEVIAEISREMAKMARLDPAADIACDIKGSARYLSDEPLGRPQQLLFDKVLTGQGIFLEPGEPLTIKLEFPTRHRIQCIQLLYAGQWQDPGVPEVTIAAIGKGGTATEVGRLPAITQQPAHEPFVQQVNFRDDTGSTGQEWRRLSLAIPQLPTGLGLVEMRVIGYDAGLRRIAGTAHQIAQQPENISPGVLSQIAASLRARRLRGDKKASQTEAVERLSALISQLSGISVELSVPKALDSDQSVAASIDVHNDSQHILEQAVVKLRLPPGWRAAPARLVIEQLGGGESIFLPVTIYPAAGSERELSAYLYGAYNGEPLFVLAVTRMDGAEEKAP